MDKSKILTNIFKEIFKINASNVEMIKFKDEQWDSINQINLILKIENKMKIKIKNNHIEKINSYSNAKKVLAKFYQITF